MLVVREYSKIADARDAMGDHPDAPLFGRTDWFESLALHCFPNQPIRVLEAMEDGKQAFLFLLTNDGRRASALANWYSFSWSPTFAGDPDEQTKGRLVEVLADRLLQTKAQLDFYPVADETGLLLEAFRRAGWLGIRRPMGRRHILDIGGRDFHAYWAARPSRLRNQVQRKMRAQRFTIDINDHVDDAIWRDYVTVHASSWKQPEPGMSFLRTLAEREGRAGRLRFGFARLGNQPVATQLWTIDNGAALIHKLSHDRAFDGASPGTLLSHAMFEHAIDRDRVRRIDYGTGDNAYKAEWMEGRETLYRLDFFNPRFASTWLPAARTAISALVG